MAFNLRSLAKLLPFYAAYDTGARAYGNYQAGQEEQKWLESQGVDTPFWYGWAGPSGIQGLRETDPNALANMPEGTTPTSQASLFGRDPIGKDLQQAGADQMEAARVSIGRQLAQSLQRTDVQYAQSGTYRSGERLSARGDLEQAAMTDLANAVAGIGLQGEQLAAQIQAQNQQYNLQLAQLEATRDATNQAAYAKVAEIMIPLLWQERSGIYNFFSGGGQVGTASQDIKPSSSLTAGPAPLQLPKTAGR